MMFDVQRGNFVRLRTILDEVQAKYIPELQELANDIRAGIQAEKLSGDPLHRISGVLSENLYAKVYRQYDQVTMSFGEPGELVYPAIHEFGAVVKMRAYVQTQKVSSARRFSSITGKRIKNSRRIQIQSHTKTYPERSYLRSYMSEHQREIIAKINGIVGKKVERWPN